MEVYVAIAVVLFVLMYLLLKKNKAKQTTRAGKPGTVALHQFNPTARVVNGSPPCLKLETFLRLTKIPYESKYDMKVSKKGKLPWISYNGKDIADSNFCVQFLTKEFNVDIDSHLSSTDRAIAHCIRTMLEENTYWAVVYYRWLLSPNTMREILFPNYFGFIGFLYKYPLFYILQRKCKKDLWSHGIGRHSEEELYGIAEKDMLAVSNVLGQKKFLFGEKPCLADVSLFAFIACSCWESPTSPFSALTKSKLQNLEEHAQRMKKLCYPDWDEVVSGNYTPRNPWIQLYSVVTENLIPQIACRS